MSESSAAKEAELAAAEVAAILAAAPGTGATNTAKNHSGPAGSNEAGRDRDEEEEEEDEDEDDEDEDVDMEDETGNGNASAGEDTAGHNPGTSGGGTRPTRSSSSLSSGSLSNLSSPTPSSVSLPDEDEGGPTPRPAAADEDGSGSDGGLDDDDSGSSDISDLDEGRNGRPTAEEADEEEGEEEQEEEATRADAAARSPASGQGSDDGSEGSDEEDEGARVNGISSEAAANADREGATGDAVPGVEGAAASDSSDLGSPESVAETEPLPFEDSQQQGADDAPLAEDEEEEQVNEESTPTTAAMAGATKEDREEVAAATPQEAMEALTRIEIQFAMLRDRLYVERMEEVCRETEMVLEGTHPELIRFTRAIDQLRERRLRLLDLELEKQVGHYEQVAEGEEQVIWNSYRYQAAELRTSMMDKTARKRRRLEREKRLIDVPRPARRHQTFETELVPNPERQYSAALRARRREIAIADASAAVEAVNATDPEAARRTADVIRQLQESAADEDAHDYVAYPEVKGLEEGELWSDLDRMGILPYNGAPALQPYYSPEELAGPNAAAGPSTAPLGGAEGYYPPPAGHALGLDTPEDAMALGPAPAPGRAHGGYAAQHGIVPPSYAAASAGGPLYPAAAEAVDGHGDLAGYRPVPADAWLGHDGVMVPFERGPRSGAGPGPGPGTGQGHGRSRGRPPSPRSAAGGTGGGGARGRGGVGPGSAFWAGGGGGGHQQGRQAAPPADLMMAGHAGW